MDNVTFHHVEPLIGIGMPLLITAIIANENTQWAGEMYLLLQDKACTVLETIVHVDGNAWPLEDLELNEQFIEQELLQQARWRLNLYWEESGHLQKYGLLTREIAIGKTNMNAAVAFWSQSTCGDKFSEIQQKTGSASLREKLRLVTSLPKFRYESNYRSQFE